MATHPTHITLTLSHPCPQGNPEPCGGARAEHQAEGREPQRRCDRDCRQGPISLPSLRALCELQMR